MRHFYNLCANEISMFDTLIIKRWTGPIWQCPEFFDILYPRILSNKTFIKFHEEDALIITYKYFPELFDNNKFSDRILYHSIAPILASDIAEDTKMLLLTERDIIEDLSDPRYIQQQFRDHGVPCHIIGQVILMISQNMRMKKNRR